MTVLVRNTFCRDLVTLVYIPDHGQTPLHYAAKGGRTACVRALIELGAAVDVKDEGGCFLLHWCLNWLNRGQDTHLLCHQEEPRRDNRTPAFIRC